MEAHRIHLVEPKEDESTTDYIYRHGQRYGDEKDDFDQAPKLKSRRKKRLVKRRRQHGIQRRVSQTPKNLQKLSCLKSGTPLWSKTSCRRMLTTAPYLTKW